MAKIVARNARIVLSGHDVSGDSNHVTLTRSAEAPEVTCFTEDNRTRLAGGIKDTEINIDSYVNMSASATEELYHGLTAGSVAVTFFPLGWATCSTAYAFPGVMMNYESTYATENAATANARISGSLFCARGKSLGSFTLASGSGSGSLVALDFGAALSNATVFLHVLSLADSASVSASLFSGSADNADDYAMTAAFDTQSASGRAVYIAVPAVGRYSYLKWTADGAGSIVSAIGTQV